MRPQAIFSSRKWERTACGVVVPQSLRSGFRATLHSRFFSALQIYDVVFVSAHLPYTGRPDNEVVEAMEELSSNLHGWKSKRKDPVKEVVVVGDFNITLPACHDELAGPHVLQRGG